MPAPDRSGLQVSDDPRFQRVFWRVERVAWLFFTAILVAALLGFTGAGGPLSRRSIETADAEITYPRVMRWATRDEIEIAVSGNTPILLGLDDAFLDLFEIRAITPPPLRSEVQADGIRMEFAAAEVPGAHRKIVFHVVPLRPSLGGSATLSLSPGDATRMSFVILP
jgi:hypothetical protein